MGIGLRDRLRAGLGTAEEWRRDREADLAHSVAELEARGHQFYGQAIRKGQEALARTTSELREFAKRQSASQGTAGPSPIRQTAHPAASGDRGQQFIANAKRILTESERKAQPIVQRVGDSGPVREIAGQAARSAGNAVGLVTGARDMGHDLVGGVVLGARLLDPTDAFRKPAGEAAWDQVFGGLGMIAGAAGDAVSDPKSAARAVVDKSWKLVRETVPMATPAAPTLSGEVRRNFDIGRHQGEIAMEVLPYAVGAGELKAAAELGALSKASRIAKYSEQGFSRAQAARLAKPYDGIGHHAVLKRSTRLPEWLGGGPVPRAILDSPFNVVKPRGMTQGDFYELHFGVDPKFYGTRVKKGRWSGQDLGLERYDLPKRIWLGTPNATKQAVAGVGIPGAIPFDDEDFR